MSKDQSNLVVHSPLEGHELVRDQFSVTEVNDCGLIRLQTFHRNEGLLDKIAAALGFTLPGSGEFFKTGNITVYWSAPGEWIFAIPIDKEQEQLTTLRKQLDGLFAVVTLMTDSRVILALSGTRARDVLARGSSVDFDPAVFANGKCLITRLAGVAVMLSRGCEATGYGLFACRSASHYLLDWFEASSEDC